MSLDRVKDIADAVLFEGYILYPYRPSAIKNQQRWALGALFPSDYRGDEPSFTQTEILLDGGAEAEVDVTLRFLHTQRRQVVNAHDKPVAALDMDGRRYVTWDEAVVREVSLAKMALNELEQRPQRLTFSFPSECKVEQLRSKMGLAIGSIIRSSEAVEAVLEVSAQLLTGTVHRLRVRICNTTLLNGDAPRADAQHHALLSTHTILVARGAEFISLLEPPETVAADAAACENKGAWPVLAGQKPAKDVVLSSPIILYDYPQIAPESKSQFFDGTEIDELLTLRVLTLTDEEKLDMAATDPRTHDILDRCQAFSREELYGLHGAFRNPLDDTQRIEPPLAIGSHVRLNPKSRGDIFDIALKDRIGIVQAIERDFEDRLHIAVTLLDDPGGDFGELGVPGHRFFFSREEVVPVNIGTEP